MTRKSAVLIGASRGLGLAITEELLARGWEVIATCRGGKENSLQTLSKSYPATLRIEHLDMTRAEEIAALKTRLGDQSFDLLFVNAGVTNANGMSEAIGDTSTEEFIRLMTTNALAPMKVVEQLGELVPVGGTIGIMSSGQGSIAGNESGGNDAYRASKAALNMLMRSFAVRRGKDRSLLLLAPGWIKTDMGGTEAKFTVQDVLKDIVETILAQEGKPGLRYLDRFGKSVRW